MNQLNIPAFSIYHLIEPQIKSSHIMKQLNDTYEETLKSVLM